MPGGTVFMNAKNVLPIIYECKKRFANYMEEARELIKHNKKAYKAEDWPNATGNTIRPKEVFPDQ
jgi:hypothetical protein